MDLNDRSFAIQIARTSPPVSSANINKPLDHFKTNDTRELDRDIVNNNNRQSQLRFTSKDAMKKNRALSFMSQE